MYGTQHLYFVFEEPGFSWKSTLSESIITDDKHNRSAAESARLKPDLSWNGVKSGGVRHTWEHRWMLQDNVNHRGRADHLQGHVIWSVSSVEFDTVSSWITSHCCQTVSVFWPTLSSGSNERWERHVCFTPALKTDPLLSSHKTRPEPSKNQPVRRQEQHCDCLSVILTGSVSLTALSHFCYSK